jgi:hypothetical protein
MPELTSAEHPGISNDDPRPGPRFRYGAHQIVKPFYLSRGEPAFRFCLAFRFHAPLDELAHFALPLIEQCGVHWGHNQHLLAATLQIGLDMIVLQALKDGVGNAQRHEGFSHPNLVGQHLDLIPTTWLAIEEALKDNVNSGILELFHRIWHRTWAGLSNGLLGGKGQRGLP